MKLNIYMTLLPRALYCDQQFYVKFLLDSEMNWNYNNISLTLQSKKLFKWSGLYMITAV